MKFTDDDLKRLKEEYKTIVGDAGIVLLKPEMDALLARLEAAERVAAFGVSLHDQGCGELHCPTFDDATAWLKIRGG